MNVIKEIKILGFDEDNEPVIRIFDNNQSYLIFGEFPPENDKLSEGQITNFEQILSGITEVKVKHDDRELFIIYSNDEKVMNKVVDFFNSL